MRTSRIYQPNTLALHSTITLSPDASHHLAKVLRAKEKAPLILFNGDGKEYHATICSISKRDVTVKILEEKTPQTESPLAIHLGQGLAKGSKMDFILQKAVELGVASITPLFSEHCDVKLPSDRIEKKMEHWKKVIISAAEQSGRTALPTLHTPIKLATWFSQPFHQQSILFDPAAKKTLKQLRNTSHSISVLIGPEGGFCEAEIELAKKNHVEALQLGPRVLRTETAGLAAITALQCLFGDF